MKASHRISSPGAFGSGELKDIIVLKISCAHACTDIFYSLNADEKWSKNAKPQRSRVAAKHAKYNKNRKNVDNLNQNR